MGWVNLPKRGTNRKTHLKKKSVAFSYTEILLVSTIHILEVLKCCHLNATILMQKQKSQILPLSLAEYKVHDQELFVLSTEELQTRIKTEMKRRQK